MRSVSVVKHSILLTAIGCLLGVLSVPVFAETVTIVNPQVEVEYVKPAPIGSTPSQFDDIYRWLNNRRPLHELPAFLAPLRLPRKLVVRVDQCGSERRHYLAGGPVTICYEFIDNIQKTAEKNTADDPGLRQSVETAMFIEGTLHEIAYAIFDMLKVPVWGRVDDAADRLSAFIMLQFAESVSRTTIQGLANYLSWPRRPWSGGSFANSESPAPQRFYNYLCLAYGADPVTFSYLVDIPKDGGDPLLPWSRAGLSIIRNADELNPKTKEPQKTLIEKFYCRLEYEQIRNAFNLRIMPYVEPDSLLKVKATQWLNPDELGSIGK